LQYFLFFKLLLVIHSIILTTQQKTPVVVLCNFHTLLLIRKKTIDFFVAASLKLSACTLEHNYSELCSNRSRGSNNSYTFFPETPGWDPP